MRKNKIRQLSPLRKRRLENKKVFNRNIKHSWKGERMKIAHFSFVGPYKCGMYETTRELCVAELEAGYDACLIDTSWYPKGKPSVTSSRDRGVDIKPLSWAADADIHALHSVIPSELYGKAPIACFLHGAPEYVFYSECFGHQKGDRGFSTLLLYAQDTKNKVQFVTLWDRHVDIWKTYLGNNVSYVPSCVDMSQFQLEGEKITLQNPGRINIGFCDSWRETYWKDPFRVMSGIRLFYERNDDVRLHFFSIPSEKKRDVLWDRTICAVKRNCPGLVGGIYERVRGMAKVYRALDIVVSPVREESRIVRESMSCGTPMITMRGRTYSNYTADFSDPEQICNALEECYKDIKSNSELPAKLSEQAKNAFDFQATVTSLGGIYSSLLESSQK